MSRTKLVNGVAVPLTGAEEGARDAEIVVNEAAEATWAVFTTFADSIVVLRGDYTQAEIDTFPTQEAEANAWLLDSTVATPLLDAILAASGEVKSELVGTIVTKAAAFKLGVGTAMGRKRLATRSILTKER